MAGLFNLGSLILGLVAWILPITSLLRRSKLTDRGRAVYLFLSLAACSISLLLQQYYNDYLVKIEDWSAMMDTMKAVSIAATALVIVTIALNAMTLLMTSAKTRD